jgi:hypothetical protein
MRTPLVLVGVGGLVVVIAVKRRRRRRSYLPDVSSGPRPIQVVGTSTAGFVGRKPDSGDAVP